MKVESKFVIDGKVVSKGFENESLIIYEGINNDQAIYLVNKQTSEFIVKIDIDTDMSQGVGFVSGIAYLEMAE